MANPATVQLIGHRTNGSDVTSAQVPIDGTRINQPVSVSSPAGDIDSFTLTSTGGDVAFDDLTFDFPANSLPDLNPTTTNQVVPVLQGATTAVQLNLGRVNGSNGPVRISMTGLPRGVSAQASPNPVTGNSTQITLAASAGAPSTDFQPVTATITADPLANAHVAPAPRTATLDVRVASPFELRLPGGASSTAALPACAPVDVPIELPRDIALHDAIHLTVGGLPNGVSAQVLPSPDVPPGGGLTAARTIRLTRASGAALPADVTVQADAPGARRTLTLHLNRSPDTASVTPGVGRTARLLSGDGSAVQVTGSGFCPGTRVLVGNPLGEVDTTLIDPHTLSFHVPRLATTGQVIIVPPHGDPTYAASDGVRIDSFRNTDGFQFHNFGFDGLSLSELTDAFGTRALFESVNPCGIWGGNCRVVTPILNPIAATEWPIISEALRSSGGHCFGISRAVQEFLAGKKSPRQFTAGPIFDIPSAARPADDIGHFLDGQHALQASDQFLTAWFNRARSVRAQLSRLESALRAGDFPIVSIRHGLDGHALLAYDDVTNSDGTVDVYTYDSNREFDSTEDANGGIHAAEVGQSTVRLDPARGTWEYLIGPGQDWQGGGDTIFVAPESVIPQDPSLPGLSTLTGALASLELTMFGSDGSVRLGLAGSSRGAEYLPALDSHAEPGAGGTVMARSGGHAMSTEFIGRKSGRYSAVVIGHDFAGAVTDVATKSGVRDALSGSRGSVTFAGGERRPLTVELAEQPSRPGGTAWSATLHTRADSHGSDTAGLSPVGALTYAHDGAPASVSFTLSSVSPQAGSARFQSRPIRVQPGDRLSVQPAAGLHRSRVIIRDARGHVRTLVLTNLLHASARLALRRPRVSGARVKVSVRISGLHGAAVMGLVLRIVRGNGLLVRRAIAVARPRNGLRTFTFRLPSALRGRYRVLVDASLVGSTGLGTQTTGTRTDVSSRMRLHRRHVSS
jgi:hypothetical protein